MSRPDLGIIQLEYERAGSIRGAARNLGYAESTMREWAAKDPRIAAVFKREPSGTSDLLLASKDAELRDLRREHKKAIEALGKREEFLQEMKDAAAVPIPYVPIFKPPVVREKDAPKRSIVLPIFDIQYGQYVDTNDVALGKGAFSEEIFDRRLERYVEKVSALLVDRATSTRFTELNIILGGDLVEGDQIYPGQAWQLETHPIQQVLRVRTKVTVALKTLIEVCAGCGVEHTAVYGVPGNHGKIGGRKSGATPSDYSWDFLATELILDQLDVDLKVNVQAGALLFETLGNTFLVIHGDEIKGAMGLPFYGIAKYDGRVMRLAETVFDYCLLGHHHQPATIPNGSGGAYLMQGDWVGGNNLSKHITAASRPQQAVYFISKRHGLTEEAHVYLDDQRRQAAKVWRKS